MISWLNPLHGEGYQFWSGIGGYAAVVAILWRHLNCYQPGCWWIGHPHPDTGHRPVCRKHHPETKAEAE